MFDLAKLFSHGRARLGPVWLAVAVCLLVALMLVAPSLANFYRT
jgi:hypothetical protein